MNKQDQAKIAAGEHAIETFVKAGMKIGLGSGTTSHFFVRALAAKVRLGLRISATATSRRTAEIALEEGIAISDINDLGELDLCLDGPDEIDSSFRMIKGGGACLLWEKIVAHSSRRMITLCDETKLVSQLGAFPLPVEVVRFGWQRTQHLVERVLSEFDVPNCKTQRRLASGDPVTTDSGNYLLDCGCGSISDPEGLEAALNNLPGVVENGLFTRESDGMCVGCFDGSAYVKHRKR